MFKLLLILSFVILSFSYGHAACLGDRVFISLKEGDTTVTHEYRFVKSHGVDQLVEMSPPQTVQSSRVYRRDNLDYDDASSNEDVVVTTTVAPAATVAPANNFQTPKAIAVQAHLVSIEKELGVLIMPPEGFSRRFEFDDAVIICKYTRYGKNVNVKCLEEGQEFMGAAEEYVPPPNLDSLAFMRALSKRLKVKSNVVSGFR